MNEAQKSVVERWLERHWLGQATCPAGHSEWSAADTMSFMPGFAITDQGPQVVHEKGFTFVPITCTTCGYVALLDSKAIGRA